MPTTLCLALELSGKLSTVLRFNHYCTLQSFASCVCLYWLYLVWKMFSYTWQLLEVFTLFGCIWRPVCFKHRVDDTFGSQNKCEKPLWFFSWIGFISVWGFFSPFFSFMAIGAIWLSHSSNAAAPKPNSRFCGRATASLFTFLPKGLNLMLLPQQPRQPSPCAEEPPQLPV